MWCVLRRVTPASNQCVVYEACVPGAVSLHREGIEDVVLSKRRFTYEQQLSENPLNYDAWFDYIKLEESTGNVDRIREVSRQGRCT